jgi:tRNA A37 methylthiotransferase MiaB
MKVFIKGLNSCGMRKINVRKYHDFLVNNDHEVVDDPKDSDIILIWTCAFRRDFRDNSLSEIQRYQKDFDSEVIVAGCLPDIDRKILDQCFHGQVINWREEEKKMEKYFGASK